MPRPKRFPGKPEAATDVTVGISGNLTPWEKGRSGNLKGRPRGSRNKLSEDFFADVYDVWQEHGREALLQSIKTEPMAFSKMVANLMPTKMESSLKVTNIFAELNLRDPREFAQAWDVARQVVYGNHPVPIEIEMPAADTSEAEDADHETV